MSVALWIAVPVVALCLVATALDLRTRRIPNLLTASAFVLALLAHLVARGTPGLLDAALGGLVAGGLMLPGWLLRWKGGGDVKLVAATGAWLGLDQGLLAALFALIAGGLVALVYAARRGVLRQSLWGASMLGAWALSGATKSVPPPVTGGVHFPFGIAVLIGTLAALWVRS